MEHTRVKSGAHQESGAWASVPKGADIIVDSSWDRRGSSVWVRPGQSHRLSAGSPDTLAVWVLFGERGKDWDYLNW